MGRNLKYTVKVDGRPEKVVFTAVDAIAAIKAGQGDAFTCVMGYRYPLVYMDNKLSFTDLDAFVVHLRRCGLIAPAQPVFRSKVRRVKQ